ncbi:MAG: ABC transporter permease [Pseudomonadota bacterium]
MIRLVPRTRPSLWLQAGASVAAVLLTLLFGVIMFALLGQPPFEVLSVFLTSPLSSAFDISDLLVKAGPLILIALGLAVGYRANIWNIGAEGQFLLGSIFGMGAVLALGNPSTAWAVPVILVAGAIGGMLWASIPAALRTAFNASELLTSLMLVYVAQQVLYLMVNQVWKNPLSFGWPETVELEDALQLPVMVDGTDIHAGLIVVLVVAAVLAILTFRTTFGYRMRMAELTPKALRFAGFGENATIWISLLLSGGLAGLAGAIELSSTFGKLNDQFSLGYGFTAIIVAFLGRLNPIGIVLGGLLVGFTFVGGDWIRVTHGVNDAAADVFQASLLFFVLACDLLTKYRLHWARRPTRQGMPAE